jgi:hypothetical protein
MSKKYYQPNTLFSFATAAIYNNNLKDNFCEKLIREEPEEIYSVVTDICWDCYETGAHYCECWHEKSLNETIADSRYLLYTEGEYCYPVPQRSEAYRTVTNCQLYAISNKRRRIE